MWAYVGSYDAEDGPVGRFVPTVFTPISGGTLTSMKYILYLIAVVGLFSTSGCIIREHRGADYGRPEYDHGYYRHYPDRDRDWDERGHWRHY